MSAPPGTIWKSQIPVNRFQAILILSSDSIEQGYFMSTQSQADYDKILKANKTSVQLLYKQSIQVQNSKGSFNAQNWIQIVGVRAQECFLQYLAKIEDEILKAKQKRGLVNA